MIAGSHCTTWNLINAICLCRIDGCHVTFQSSYVLPVLMSSCQYQLVSQHDSQILFVIDICHLNHHHNSFPYQY